MTSPDWTPTPEADLPDPAVVLGWFGDVPPGNITAGKLRDLVQAVYSALHWASTAALLEQQVLDIAQVTSSLVSDVTSNAAHLVSVADNLDDLALAQSATRGVVEATRDDVDELIARSRA